uniref:Uncharacterized protein n=1 Tax=Lactuca sativa TaxID=4236 RepID=A0A9R1X3S8_LACSA|nr:hypothetical protein LSAT_V11C600322520 [Lactuca sativa]
MFFNGNVHTGRAVSDVLISNMCEVFNGKIEKGRDKPIIGCLEYIRELKLLNNTLLGGMGETSIKSQELCRVNMWLMLGTKHALVENGN